jgi:hypothetical protein
MRGSGRPLNALGSVRFTDMAKRELDLSSTSVRTLRTHFRNSFYIFDHPPPVPHALKTLKNMSEVSLNGFHTWADSPPPSSFNMERRGLVYSLSVVL